MNVPMPSAKIADPQGTLSWLETVSPMPQIDRAVREDGPDREHADHGPDDLGDPVGGDLPPREALGERQTERDGGVDVDKPETFPRA